MTPTAGGAEADAPQRTTRGEPGLDIRCKSRRKRMNSGMPPARIELAQRQRLRQWMRRHDEWARVGGASAARADPRLPSVFYPCL
jgi:hypothetical protein